MSRWITTSQLYYQGQKFKWYKISSINFFGQQGMMFRDIGTIEELEPNEITSTWLYIYLLLVFLSFHEDFLLLGFSSL